MDKGFTLIELSVVLIIVGLLVAPLLSLYNVKKIDEQIEITKQNINVAGSAVAGFDVIRLPCPSDRSLPPEDPDYGFEQCNLATIPNCTTGTEGICKTSGSWNADGSGGADSIVIGGVPYRYMGVDEFGNPAVMFVPNMQSNNTLDGWNNKLTYAVSANLMDPLRTSTKNDFKLGVIAAIDENGNPTAGIGTYDLDNLDADNNLETGRDGDAQFVVLSHGKTARGAFNLSGQQTFPCPAATVVESDNCDNDFTFVQGLGSYEGAGNGFLDDYSYFYIESSGDLWYTLPDSANSPSPHINNLNSDNVGINTTTPQVKLDINGNLMADTVRANSFCNKSGTTCISSSYFGSSGAYFGSSYNCAGSVAAGSVMIGIKSGNPICSKISYDLPTGYTGVTCPGAANWVAGVTTDGCVYCTDGSKVCP
ncbi:MAG: type II secretion system protein [Alphaproteobacteria bacterium]|nr:type II secretion system protein [Alphaproteobacteria bacterium]